MAIRETGREPCRDPLEEMGAFEPCAGGARGRRKYSKNAVRWYGSGASVIGSCDAMLKPF